MTPSQSLSMAYADPPYLGQSKKHYEDHPDYAGEVDHGDLIDRLLEEFPDGWALSASSPSLFYIQSLLADRGLLPMDETTFKARDYRVMSWIKPFCAFKRNVRVAYAWEPILVKPAPRLEGAQPTRDFIEDLQYFDLDLAVREPITMKRGLTGVKPERVCHWLFGAMGLRREGDDLHDLFPGSGAVGAAWDSWRMQLEVAA